jgi:hypothetical protein
MQNLSQDFCELQKSTGHPDLRLRYKHGTFHTLDKGVVIFKELHVRLRQATIAFLYKIDDKYHCPVAEKGLRT